MARRSSSTAEKSRAFVAVNTAVLLLIAVGCLYPFVYVLAVSLSDADAVNTGGIWLWPEGFNFYTYQHVFTTPRLGVLRALMNSILYTFVSTVVSVALTYLTGYALSRRKLPSRHAIMFVFIATWIFDAGIVPAYLVNERLGFVNNWLVMVIPPAVSTFLLIITRSFLQAIPNELEEAAGIDGANDWQIMSRVFFPLSKPVLATIGIFYAVQTWNSFLLPLIYLRDEALRPIQLVLYELLVADDPSSTNFEQIVINGVELAPESIRAAIMVLAMVPIVAMYPYAQRYFAKGMLIGSVKG
ncbi:carbohydrate ABC transporter permease [Ruania suaedae]|uniref:carbohydrate ABC transporter permease n=1 Tax=Ruania suaedae TaxID=2897774 RepID=UPI001E4CE3F0|nr:carbohydrate ABC transporter permease [Ruania suaedae]UFU03776.1 carbohydrate ABC transporter permease [Ruania suaedae]